MDPRGHCHHRSYWSCSDCPQGSAPCPAGAGAGAGAAAVAAAVAAAAAEAASAAAAAAAGSLMGSFDPGEVKLVLT